jgi:hypothetical protein
MAGALCAQAAPQTSFTAGTVMSNMAPEERYTFVAGIVEGLAHARYVKDGKDPAGRACIYAWFYDEKLTMKKIFEAFDRYPNALPGQIVGALVATKCGA